MINVMIICTPVLIREGLAKMLLGDDDINVGNCFASLEEAADEIEKESTDVILLDNTFLNEDGLEKIRFIKSSHPTIKLISFIDDWNEETISAILVYEIDAYLLKNVDLQKLVATIKSVSEGFRVIHDEAFRELSQRFGLSNILTLKNSRKKAKLKDRDVQILQNIVEGKENNEIAASLFLSEASIKRYISHMLKQLNLKDRLQLAVFALKNKIVI